MNRVFTMSFKLDLNYFPFNEAIIFHRILPRFGFYTQCSFDADSIRICIFCQVDITGGFTIIPILNYEYIFIHCELALTWVRAHALNPPIKFRAVSTPLAFR